MPLVRDYTYAASLKKFTQRGKSWLNAGDTLDATIAALGNTIGSVLLDDVVEVLDGEMEKVPGNGKEYFVRVKDNPLEARIAILDQIETVLALEIGLIGELSRTPLGVDVLQPDGHEAENEKQTEFVAI